MITVLFPLHIVIVPANVTAGVGIAVMLIVLLTYGGHPELVTLTLTCTLADIGNALKVLANKACEATVV